MPACTPGLHVTGPALFVFVSSISSVHPHPTHLSASILRPSNSFTLNKHISSRFVFICKQCSIRISGALSRMWHECLVCTCASVIARSGETPGAGRIWCVDNDSVYHFLILISLRLGCYQRKDRKARSKQYAHRGINSLGPMQRDRDVAKQTTQLEDIVLIPPTWSRLKLSTASHPSDTHFTDLNIGQLLSISLIWFHNFKLSHFKSKCIFICHGFTSLLISYLESIGELLMNIVVYLVYDVRTQNWMNAADHTYLLLH